MPIVGICGPEGAGKTVLMTRYAKMHHDMGGDVFAFPGYELKIRGKTKSKLLMPEDWVTLPPELQDLLICIDEIQNFFNKHTWYYAINDLFAGLLAERRKRRLCVIYTGPFFEWLPGNIQQLTHEVIRCEDRYWKMRVNNPNARRGEEISFTREDRRGVLSGQIGRITQPRIFHSKPYWKNYDTLAAVDLLHRFQHVKVQAKLINIGQDGKVIEMPVVDDNKLDAVLASDNTFNPAIPGNPINAALHQIATYLKNKGVTKIPTETVKKMLLEAAGINKLPHGAIGRVLGSYGYKFTQGYGGNNFYGLKE